MTKYSVELYYNITIRPFLNDTALSQHTHASFLHPPLPLPPSRTHITISLLLGLLRRSVMTTSIYRTWSTV